MARRDPVGATREEMRAWDAELETFAGTPLPEPLFERLTVLERRIVGALLDAAPDPITDWAMHLVCWEYGRRPSSRHTLHSHLWRIRDRLKDSAMPLKVETLNRGALAWPTGDADRPFGPTLVTAYRLVAIRATPFAAAEIAA